MKKRLHGFLTLFLALVVQLSFAQVSSVTGTVTDEEGMPVPGVNVIVQGTNNGAQTDFDGNYTIKASQGDVLVFTYVGFVSQSLAIGSSDTMNVVLKVDAGELAEVIILGYTQRGVNEVTGNVVQVGGEQLAEMPVVSADQALQGRVAGLQISQSSGTPGSTQDIRIRGVGSITAGNEPLFVIDGVPVINTNFSGSNATSSLSPLASINSQDIESMTVLKDASATAAYGARGSNGVIVITTKNGKSGKTTFNVTSTTGFQNRAVEGRKPLTGAQRKELFTDQVFNTYGADNGLADRDAAYNFGIENGLDYEIYKDWDGTETNWGDLTSNDDALTQNYTISAQGGDEKSSFYASLGYNDTEATVIASDFQRISGKLNYNRDLSDRVRFTSSLSVSNIAQNGILEQAAYFANPHLVRYFMPPTDPAYNEDGSYNFNTSVFNPLHLADNDIVENDLTRALVNSTLEWDIVDNLTFKTLIGLDYNLSNYRRYDNRIHGNSDGATNGSAESSVERNYNFVTQNSLSYDWTIDEHSVTVTALTEYQKNKNNYLYAAGENFPADDLTYLANAPGSQEGYANFEDWTNISYLGLLNYGYASKYIADFTYRREGSSKFAEGNRFGDFWSVGLAWNLHNEDFLAGTDLFNQLRVRGSYGKTGNSAIDPNSYQAFLSYDEKYAGQGAVYPSQFGNSVLTWENAANFDAGLEFGILNNVVTGSFAYYNRETTDLLQEVPLSRTTGHVDQNINVGTMVNKGIEAELGVNIFRTENFNWNVNANFATVDNEVTDLAEGGDGEFIAITNGSRRTEVGHPVYEWYMRKYAGVNTETGSPQWYVDGVDGEVTSNYSDASPEFQGKSALPTYSGGVSTHVDFKGFFVDANIYFAGGHSVYEDWSFYTQHAGIYTTLYYNGTEALMDRWQQPGDITDVPKMVYDGIGGRASSTSSRFLYDGDYVRLKNVAFGYDLPSKFLEGVGFDGLRIAVRGTNLLTWVKDDGLKYDPEVRADGYTRLTTPPIKSVTLNLNLKF